jgi:hypothetical protein
MPLFFAFSMQDALDHMGLTGFFGFVPPVAMLIGLIWQAIASTRSSFYCAWLFNTLLVSLGVWAFRVFPPR